MIYLQYQVGAVWRWWFLADNLALMDIWAINGWRQETTIKAMNNRIVDGWIGFVYVNTKVVGQCWGTAMKQDGLLTSEHRWHFGRHRLVSITAIFTYFQNLIQLTRFIWWCLRCHYQVALCKQLCDFRNIGRSFVEISDIILTIIYNMKLKISIDLNKCWVFWQLEQRQVIIKTPVNRYLERALR